MTKMNAIWSHSNQTNVDVFRLWEETGENPDGPKKNMRARMSCKLTWNVLLPRKNM